jgi:arylsulfatase A-like enzyme
MGCVMERSRTAVAAGVAAGLVALTIGAMFLNRGIVGQAVGDAERNYLIVIADDLGTDKVSGYQADYAGYQGTFIPKMDTLDSLADAGIRFTRGWANPLCVPTRASLFTGLQPLRHGQGASLEITDPGIDPEAYDMLAERLVDGGFATALFGKWQVGNEDENGQIGYPTTSPYEVAPHPSRAGWTYFDGSFEGIGAGGGYGSWDRLTWSDFDASGEYWVEAAHPTEELTAEAAAWIGDQTGHWAAVIAYQAPHGAVVNGVSPVWQYSDVDPTCVRSAELSCLATRNCSNESKAVYQAMAECLDLNLDELLNGMDPAVLDRTTIVFVGDNGTPSQVQEGSFNQGSNRGKGSVYENGLRVPYIVADGATWRSGAAGVISSPGRTSSAPVHTTDLYATVLEAALGTPAATLDSRSFLGCFTDDSDDCGFADSGGYAEQIAEDNGRISSASAAVRIGTDKMTFAYNASKVCYSTKQYNLTADPFELTPLTAKNVNSTALRNRFTSLHLGTSSWADGLAACDSTKK